MALTPLRVIFMGTPEFAVPSLRSIAAATDIAKILCVYTQPDRPAHRGQKLTPPPIKRVAEELGLAVRQPENVNTPDELRILSDYMADVVVVVAYAQFLGKALLSLPRLGCINVHSSLLPKYRGAAPIQYAIWKGESESGISTMRLVSKMDAGPILLQEKTPITPDMTAPELHDRLSAIGGGLIVKTLRGLQDSSLHETPQDEARATYAKLIRKEDGLLDWTHSGIELINQIRALNPWPGTHTQTNRGRLVIQKARFHDNVSGVSIELRPGSATTVAGTFLIRCADGWIEPLVVQPEGRRAMQVVEYLNGIRHAPLHFE